MQEHTSITKNLGKVDTGDEVTFRVWQGSDGVFSLRFCDKGLGMENKVWLSRDQLHIVSDLLVEALEEDEDG